MGKLDVIILIAIAQFVKTRKEEEDLRRGRIIIYAIAFTIAFTMALDASTYNVLADTVDFYPCIDCESTNQYQTLSDDEEIDIPSDEDAELDENSDIELDEDSDIELDEDSNVDLDRDPDVEIDKDLDIESEITPLDISPMIDSFLDLQSAIAAAPADGTPTNITLTGNITLEDVLLIDQNRYIILDGAGYTITQNTTGQRHFNVGTSVTGNIGTLSLQNITLTGAGGTGNRGGIDVQMNASLTISNTIIEHNQSNAGGGINSSGNVDLLAGAIIRNNTVSGHGGGIHTSFGGAVTNMYAGSVVTQNVAMHGGGVMGMGLLVMHDGSEVSFNRAAANGAGGGVMSWTSRAGAPAFIMYGGVIEGNIAQVGGGIALLGTSAAAAGENAITGIIYNGEIINNGQIDGFVNTVQGGGIFLQGWARLTVHDATISGNFASGGGGGIMVSSGAAPATNPPISSLSIISGLIDDNNSGASGGGIMLNGSATNSGSSIATLGAAVMVSNNNAVGSGGGIAVAGITADNTTMLTINSSSIYGNTAEVNGGGIAIWPAPRLALSMPSGSVQRNTGANGGGIFVNSLPSINIGSPVLFTCNIATNGAVPPPETLPINIASTSSTIFHHALNNFDINLEGEFVTNIVIRFYPGNNGDFEAPYVGDSFVERLFFVADICDLPALAVPDIEPDTGWGFIGWRQNGIENAPLLSAADIIVFNITGNMSFTAQYEAGDYYDNDHGNRDNNNVNANNVSPPTITPSERQATVPRRPSTATPNRQPATEPNIPPTIAPIKQLPPNAALITDRHIRYVSGYPDGTFRQDNSITRAEVTAMLFNLIADNAKFVPVVSGAEQFSDVSDTHWYFQAISYLAQANIISGYPDGTFRPNTAMTRAELTTVLSRFFEHIYSYSPFFDTESHWAYMYISSAFGRGWITGYPDGTFRPDNPITRAETVTIINRALNRRPNPLSIDYHLTFYLFLDLNRSHWAFYQIMEAAIEHEFKLDENDSEIWIKINL